MWTTKADNVIHRMIDCLPHICYFTLLHVWILSQSDAQIRKIILTAKKHTSVTIRLSKNSSNGIHKLPFSETSINQLSNSGGGINLTLSYEQIEQWIKNKEVC